MYVGNLFLPGQEGCRCFNLLVDTACTYNLLLQTVLDRLPAQTQQQTVQRETMAAMADGSSLHIYKIIRLSGRLRSLLSEADFLRCSIANDAILVWKFLSQ